MYRRYGKTLTVMMLALLAGLHCRRERSAHTSSTIWLDDPVVTGRATAPKSIAVDLYIDATDSMAGFVADSRSVYVTMLSQLEAAIQQGWTDAATTFYKFGTTIVPISREQYVTETHSAPFYLDPRTRRHTNIDLVIDTVASDRVTIVVTDLFQDKSDVNRLVHGVKEKCFKNGVDVAIVALRSEFNGMVHDTRSGSFIYTSTADPSSYRPVYLLLFGNSANLQLLVDRIAALPQLGPQHHLLISDHVVARYVPTVKKQRGDRAVNPRRSDAPGEFVFDLKKGFDFAPLDMDVRLEQKPGAPLLHQGKVELVDVNGGMVEDFVLEGAQRTADAIKGVLQLRSRKPPGTYRYDLLLRASTSGALTTPAWVAEYSSQDPRPDHEANRTLNLDAFVGGLIEAKNTITPPVLARMVVVVNRK